jgi:hypothetical protein
MEWENAELHVVAVPGSSSELGSVWIRPSYPSVFVVINSVVAESICRDLQYLFLSFPIKVPVAKECACCNVV